MRGTGMLKEELDPNESRREIFLLAFLNGSTRYPVGTSWVNIKQKFFRIICIAKLMFTIL